MTTILEQQRLYTRHGPVYVWTSPASDGLLMPDWVYEGFDLFGAIPDSVPRPSTATFIHLGHTDDLRIIPEEGLKEEDSFRSKTIEDFLVEQDTDQVEANLAFNYNPVTVPIFRKVGTMSGGRYTGGGGRRKPKRSLLILWENKSREPDNDYYFEARLYFRGIFEAAEIPGGYDYEPIKMKYRALIGKDANGCDRRAPGQLYAGLFFRINAAGETVEVDPLQPGVDISLPAPTFLPVMSGL